MIFIPPSGGSVERIKRARQNLILALQPAGLGLYDTNKIGYKLRFSSFFCKKVTKKLECSEIMLIFAASELDSGYPVNM